MKAFRLVFGFAIVLSMPVTLSAQVRADDGPTTEAIRLGIVSLDPRFRIVNIGIDTNVFNEPLNPRRDTTATAATGMDLWLRTGRGQLTVSADSEFVYFGKFSSERSLSSNARGAYAVRFNRIQPFAFAATRDANQRPNEEITARVRHYTNELGGGFDLRVFSKSTMRLELREQRSGFSDDAVFGGYSLKEQLNRTTRLTEATWRQQLTALTTFVTRISYDDEQYEFQSVRNSNSYRVNTGFELGQLALIRGTVNVGYHVLQAKQPEALPEHSGITANIDVAYTAPTQTRIQVGVERELRQSFDPRNPHYTQSGWRGSITQRIFGRWDLQVSGGRAEHDYSSALAGAERRDRLDRMGGGIGYTLARQLRAGFDVLSVKRTSQIAAQSYSGIVGGFSFTYGY